MTMLDQPTLDRAAAVLREFKARSLTLATAESCTGGLVAASLTHHAGSGDVFLGGYVTYANEIKHRALGVPLALLEQHGAVSAAVAAAMVEGALAASGASRAVAITGIAGPTGGSAEKPVGLVWFGVGGADGPTVTDRQVFAGDRAAIRRAATAHALDLLRQRLG